MNKLRKGGGMGLLNSLDLAIRVLRKMRGWKAKHAADRLQREFDMRHRINQDYGKRKYAERCKK